MMKKKQLLEKRKARIIEEYETTTIKSFILDKIQLAEQKSYNPYYNYNEEVAIEEEFNCNIYKEYKNFKEMMFRELKQIEEKINQIEEEMNDFEEIEDDDLKYVINIQLRKNYIKIEQTIGNYPEDQVWVYKNFFGLDINNPEELEKIERDGILREMIPW